MPLNGLASKTLFALCIGGASHAYAESATDPISTIGLIGSHNRYSVEFDDGEEIEQERLNLGGLFYTFGNKLTGQEGMIYQISVEGQYNKRDDITYKTAQAEFDFGPRATLSTHNYVDIVLGGGYGWTHIEQDGDSIGLPGVDVQGEYKLPFAKAGLGYNYLTPSYTMRLEVGARYSLNGRIKVEIDGSSNSFDLENKINPYGELTLLWNKGPNSLPVSTSLYYTQTHYRVEDDNSELKQKQLGLKVGLAF